MADVRHGVPHRIGADAIVAVDRARLVIHDVQRRRTPEHFLGFLELEVAILNERRDAFLLEELVHGAVVGRLVVGQGFHTIRRQIVLRLTYQIGNSLVVAGLGVGDMIGERDLVIYINQ